MKLAVITPVGPGHEAYVGNALASVRAAQDQPHPFDYVKHIVVEDPRGRLGRSKARNLGMVDADWYFFLDADDRMRPDALSRNDFTAAATFGAVCLNGKVLRHNVHPCGWAELASHGAAGTLSMGFFCRADVAQSLRFDESLNAGEDFDFYMRLPGFTKIAAPLVDIGYDLPSAGGPRGYVRIDWVTICNERIAAALARGDHAGCVGSDAILEPAQRA